MFMWSMPLSVAVVNIATMIKYLPKTKGTACLLAYELTRVTVSHLLNIQRLGYKASSSFRGGDGFSVVFAE